MTSTEILDKIYDAVRRVIKRPDLELDETSGLDLTEGWDSLANTQIILEVEGAFDVKFPPKVFLRLTSVASLRDTVADVGKPSS
jgi:acyl carrier protein